MADVRDAESDLIAQPQLIVYTIGHSTRTLEEFVALLRVHDIHQLADIRTVPRSRRYPHFSRDSLAVSLPAHGITHRHVASLGGLRRPRRDSPNAAWKNERFRGYADYMGTPAFEDGLADLLRFAAEAPTVMMCAEAVWWRCHRGLVSDVLVARDVEVLHLVSSAKPSRHRLNPMARVVNGRVEYPLSI